MKWTGKENSLGGRTYTYRGFEVWSAKGEHIWTARTQPEGLPFKLNGSGVGVITRVIDYWLDQGRLPPEYKWPAK
ncbi:hypothetical protein [Roseomonas indoligenes]|uniref:Uncharacterized protein n=1 Tax=Roseomonas indoligenes TaxID=2820811 RepID=A0A940S6P4_9PROT|nr:hypothetical protein [Pararoseomonas indoligenes]MBP0492208.1 hypothetical protein [Pararoseomonas indoligenes]